MQSSWFDVPAERFVFGNHTKMIIETLVQDSAPEFANDLPGFKPWHVESAHDDKHLIICWTELDASRMNVAGDLASVDFDAMVQAAGITRSYLELRAIPELSAHFGPRRLLILLDVVDGKVNGMAWVAQIADWLQDEPAAQAKVQNVERVNAALPIPPNWEVAAIADACWVVESDEGCSQGTAFFLNDVGFVTCHHVLHSDEGRLFRDLIIFHPCDPAARYPLENVRANKALDLAVFSSCAPLRSVLDRDQNIDVALLAHVAVCGYPNFSPGSTCSISPGVVVAYKMVKGGVRRLLTNAGIVAGMSGGPAVSSGRQVVGICANGAPYFQDARDTEDQALIPVDAIDMLLVHRP